MGTDKPRYLVKIKGRFFWRPTPRMKDCGFADHPLGADEVKAKQRAIELNAEWDKARRSEVGSPRIMIYPRGSLGEAYNRALKMREAERQAKGIVWTNEQHSRDDWPRAWKWIGPVFGDLDPNRVRAEDLLALAQKVAQRISDSERFRIIKVWRALWARLPALKYQVDPNADPSFLFSNTAPQPRQNVWQYHEVLKLVQRAWREGYHGLAAIMAVAWDSMLSPVDARKLTPGHHRADEFGSWFSLDRTKTGRPAAGTLTQWSEAILVAYVRHRGVELLRSTPLFWSRDVSSGPKGGRPRVGKPYSKDRLGKEFRHIRELVFGLDEKRQIQDMRRSGADEAIVGGISSEKLSSKLANTLSQSNRLHKTYVPVNLSAVRDTDQARATARALARRRRVKRTERDEKVATAPDSKVATLKPDRW